MHLIADIFEGFGVVVESGAAVVAPPTTHQKLFTTLADEFATLRRIDTPS